MRCTRLSLSLSSLLVFCIAVCTVPGSNAQCHTESSCQSLTLIRSVPDPNLFAKRQPFAPNSKASTNAERLSNGLPPLPPTRRYNRLLPRAPQPSPVPMVTYRGHIQVSTDDPANTVLGYLASDSDYWTPMLSTDETTALQIEFSLPVGEVSGTQLQLQQIDARGPIFGLVVGREATDSNIGSGSFNYLYFDPVYSPGTSPGSTPQNVDSFFSTSTGLQKAAETSVWSVDLTTGLMNVQWINTDGSSPTTRVFVQNNHLYAGGDSTAFQSRFSSPVTGVRMKLSLSSES